MRTWLMLVVACLILGGCQVTKVTDPNTGETEKQYVLDAPMADKVEAGAEVAIGAGGIASTFFPWLIPVVTAAGGALASWRRIRPKLETAVNERDAYYTGGSVLAQALEEVKTTMPDVWKKVGPVIEKANGPVGRAEDAIRGFRGLPPRG